MPKRITEQSRVEQIFLAATMEDAQRYLAVAGAILMARFPQAVKMKVTDHRKPKQKPLDHGVAAGPQS